MRTFCFGLNGPPQQPLLLEAPMGKGARKCYLNYQWYSQDTQEKRREEDMIKHTKIYSNKHILMGLEQRLKRQMLV